ncbi:hypothetical protein D1872_334830 [compost metagenome]
MYGGVLRLVAAAEYDIYETGAYVSVVSEFLRWCDDCGCHFVSTSSSVSVTFKVLRISSDFSTRLWYDLSSASACSFRN